MDQTIQILRHQIAACETQLQNLKAQLCEAEAQASLRSADRPHDLATAINGGVPDDWRHDILSLISHHQSSRFPLSRDEYKRYGRQLIMPEVGLQGQLRLKKAQVLVVGVGGLGCPALAYLAGAGVGTLGLVDGDEVEESNLHRQILHSTSKVGLGKVDSGIKYIGWLNPTVKCIPHRFRLTPDLALETFQNYDLVLDCTDTPASRYLISDACVLLGKPLVSASALRTEGQLMVLNNPPCGAGDVRGGPCYRCVFPKPPPADSVVSCSDGGILGPVVGVMGVLQALEAIKLLVAGISLPNRPSMSHMNVDGSPSSDRSSPQPAHPEPPSLLLFSAYATPPFRSMRLRGRKPTCAACSEQATITRGALMSGSMDYVQFCGLSHPVSILSPSERISAANFAQLRIADPAAAWNGAEYESQILVDVREKVQYDLCPLENSINIPFSHILSIPDSPVPSPGARGMTPSDSGWIQRLLDQSNDRPIYVICRLGNDSQLAVKKFKQLGLDQGGRRFIGDIYGGLRAWREEVDPDFPDY